ncbi:MAG: DUF4426 domain-containing protein [Gammaproteobacteria bacterium]|nr:DUF4426 domain-containing protein [Gammaproteobacteria bacterium]
MKSIKLLLLLFFSCILFNQVKADNNSYAQSHYVFQYNAFPSDSLSSLMTNKYGFKRSKNTALVNITIIDKDSDSLFKGIKAEVNGAMKNLLAQERKLKFKEIFEDNAYYYIAEVKVEHKDLVNMNIEVKPYNANQLFTFKFTKQFITK